MGAWLVASLVAGEAFLLGAGMTGRLDRVRLAPLVRGGALLSIGTLLLTGVIEWSPRYYAVIVWLVVTTLGGFRRRSRGGQPVAVRRAIVVGLSTLLVTFLAASPILVFPEFAPILPTGDLPVASSVRTIVDTSRVDPFSKHGRDRLLTIGIWYPVDVSATYPLVVFSHGAFGIRNSNVSLFSDLASHGYVVASVDHSWHSLFSTDESGHTVLIAGTYMSDVRAEYAGRDPERSFRLYQEWMGLRMADLDFVIDHILDHRGDPIFGLVDQSRIGLAGHSLGGAAALGLGRSRTDVGAVVALEAPSSPTSAASRTATSSGIPTRIPRPSSASTPTAPGVISTSGRSTGATWKSPATRPRTPYTSKVSVASISRIWGSPARS